MAGGRAYFDGVGPEENGPTDRAKENGARYEEAKECGCDDCKPHTDAVDEINRWNESMRH